MMRWTTLLSLLPLLVPALAARVPPNTPLLPAASHMTVASHPIPKINIDPDGTMWKMEKEHEGAIGRVAAHEVQHVVETGQKGSKWIVPDRKPGPQQNALPNLPGECDHSCPPGTRCKQVNPQLAICADIDECIMLPNGGCEPGTMCVNTVGGRVCKDLDECAQNNGGCGSGFTCTNYDGGRLCEDINECEEKIEQNGILRPMANCKEGYVCANKEGDFECMDINECEYMNGGCSPAQVCKNTKGSYDCGMTQDEKEKLELNMQFSLNPGAVGAVCAVKENCHLVCLNDTEKETFQAGVQDSIHNHTNSTANATRSEGSGSGSGTVRSKLSDAVHDVDAAVKDVDKITRKNRRLLSQVASTISRASRAHKSSLHAHAKTETTHGVSLVSRLREQIHKKNMGIYDSEEGQCCPLCDEGYCKSGVFFESECVNAEMFAELMDLKKRNEQIAEDMLDMQERHKDCKDLQCQLDKAIKIAEEEADNNTLAGAGSDSSSGELPPSILVHIID